MAHVIPTAAELKAFYPAFAAVPTETVELYITRASTDGVDTSWREVDYGPAIMAIAAHRMALVGIGSHGEAAGYARAGVTRIRSGNYDASLSAEHVNRVSSQTLTATPYGTEYKRLLMRNKGGPRVVQAQAVPYAEAFPPWAC